VVSLVPQKEKATNRGRKVWFGVGKKVQHVSIPVVVGKRRKKRAAAWTEKASLRKKGGGRVSPS